MIWTPLIVFLLHSTLTGVSSAIQCFSCSVMTEVIATYNSRVIIPSCNSYDGSDKFIIDCPYSTMCLRTIHNMYLINGQKIMTTTLGCAQQKQSQHVLSGRVWKEQLTVKEVYPEDCVTETDNNLAAATRTYCYCRGNLCNLAKSVYISPKSFDLMLILFATLTFCRVL